MRARYWLLVHVLGIVLGTLIVTGLDRGRWTTHPCGSTVIFMKRLAIALWFVAPVVQLGVRAWTIWTENNQGSEDPSKPLPEKHFLVARLSAPVLSIVTSGLAWLTFSHGADLLCGMKILRNDSGIINILLFFYSGIAFLGSLVLSVTVLPVVRLIKRRSQAPINGL